MELLEHVCLQKLEVNFCTFLYKVAKTPTTLFAIIMRTMTHFCAWHIDRGIDCLNCTASVVPSYFTGGNFSFHACDVGTLGSSKRTDSTGSHHIFRYTVEPPIKDPLRGDLSTRDKTISPQSVPFPLYVYSAIS